MGHESREIGKLEVGVGENVLEKTANKRRQARRMSHSAVLMLKLVIPRSLWPSQYLMQLTKSRTNLVVRLGPFQGMIYAGGAVCSAYIPKLLGIYERELARLV